MQTLIRRYPLISFVVICYAISWSFLYPSLQLLLHSKSGFPPLALFGLVGAFGPSITAIIVLAATQGAAGVRAALKKFLQWRVHLRWYLFALLVPVCAEIMAALMQKRLGADVRNGFRQIPLWIAVAFPFGPLPEELGWRGFLLPELLRRHGPVKSTLILGCLWTTWHLASFSYPGAAIPSFEHVNAYSVFLFFCNILTVSFLFTYLFLRTGGSLLLAVLLHTSFDAASNITQGFFPSLEAARAVHEHEYITTIVLQGIIAAACFALSRRGAERAKPGVRTA